MMRGCYAIIIFFQVLHNVTPRVIILSSPAKLNRRKEAEETALLSSSHGIPQGSVMLPHGERSTEAAIVGDFAVCVLRPFVVGVFLFEVARRGIRIEGRYTVVVAAAILWDAIAETAHARPGAHPAFAVVVAVYDILLLCPGRRRRILGHGDFAIICVLRPPVGAVLFEVVRQGSDSRIRGIRIDGRYIVVVDAMVLWNVIAETSARPGPRPAFAIGVVAVHGMFSLLCPGRRRPIVPRGIALLGYIRTSRSRIVVRILHALRNLLTAAAAAHDHSRIHQSPGMLLLLLLLGDEGPRQPFLDGVDQGSSPRWINIVARILAG
mmetsp:Transcript_13921/g.33743  ORF Transcript_13921/g.33743 Transcript_13921/m.33743 type:complete len:322 (-) Transcript_13921:240-1205(-)